MGDIGAMSCDDVTANHGRRNSSQHTYILHTVAASLSHTLSLIEKRQWNQLEITASLPVRVNPYNPVHPLYSYLIVHVPRR